MPNTQSFTVSVLAARTVKTLRKAIVPIAQIAGGGQVLLILLSVLLMGPSPLEMNAQVHPVGQLLWTLCIIPISVIMMTAVLLALKTARAGRTPHWKPVLKTAAARFWPVLGAFLLILLAMWLVLLAVTAAFILLGAVLYLISSDAVLILLLPAGLTLLFVLAASAIYVMFVSYAVALEDAPVFSSLKYAHGLIKGRFWSTLGLCLVAWAAMAALTLAVGLVQLMVTPLYLLGVWLGAAVTWCLSVPFSVLNTAVTLGAGAEIYADRQNRAKTNAPVQD